MPKIIANVHCIDFNNKEEVATFLRYLRENRAKISAWDQKKPNYNTFAIVTKYRVKKEIEK